VRVQFTRGGVTLGTYLHRELWVKKTHRRQELTKMDVNAHISREPRRKMRNDTGDSGERSEIYREGNVRRAGASL
jgi:hypothetical protein